ncbi:Rne/Rng family ribonuclease [Parvibaculaceae bacterium PLY_AMNH_Bact1]|nr:Rne/Rng family ribonuclease [Parvibaculaceae bacterium PLY_AMNH_Bact1]
MGNKMLIDAAHPEETRVVVVHGNRVEEFDFESENKKQLRGNIYLAKVTRVEPSLQAAFVEYGGNRHGFLAFNEIHPDYYQIPVADREELLKEWAAETRAQDDDEDDAADDVSADDEADGEADVELDAGAEDTDAEEADDASSDPEGDEEAADVASDETVEAMGSEDAIEEAQPKKQRRQLRSYKIQEVIKRRQVILIQVVKEERGNKGAALTTYLSLAGRYCVLMPNTARGGGISRKITNGGDRKKLKAVAEGLDVPEGMGLIVRTAGAKRTKTEIKRDFEYLLRLWERVRDLTLESMAPALVYEEGSLIKRSIRDLYSKDIDQVLIEGDGAYREAKDFMRMLMPSHAKNVQPYKDREPIFQKHSIDTQLDAMFSETVTLKSGGYLVINQTEALVAIDVNSGRATKERNIEATALKTNLEAAAEAARQFRLRDLAGLIVIDFIDMDENRNNRAVERKLKEALKSDRARIQVGRISHFGLLEMSRQRMRAGIIEGSTVVCPACSGSGFVRSVESTALHVLRAVEAEAVKGKNPAFTVTVSPEVAIYILNQKRSHLLEIEATYGVSIYIETDRDVHGSDHKVEPAAARGSVQVRPPVTGADVAEEVADDESETRADNDDEEEQPKRKRRRRRRRGGRKSDDQNGVEAEAEAKSADDADGDADTESDASASESNGDEDGSEEEKPKRRRRRGRRGGRRNRKAADADAENGSSEDDAATNEPGAVSESVDAETEAETEEAPVLVAYSREQEDEPENVEAETPEEPVSEAVEAEDEAAESGPEAEMVEAAAPEAEITEPAPEPKEEKPAGPAKSGWWRRRSSAD